MISQHTRPWECGGVGAVAAGFSAAWEPPLLGYRRRGSRRCWVVGGVGAATAALSAAWEPPLLGYRRRGSHRCRVIGGVGLPALRPFGVARGQRQAQGLQPGQDREYGRTAVTCGHLFGWGSKQGICAMGRSTERRRPRLRQTGHEALAGGGACAPDGPKLAERKWIKAALG